MRTASALLLFALAPWGSTAVGQGAYLSSAGPVHRATGGASTAAALDVLGATYWNPATLRGLDAPAFAFGVDLISSHHTVTSAIGPVGGTSDADNGFFPVPSVAWVTGLSRSAVAIGLSVSGVAGFKTNLPASATNPVLAPAPLGLGRVSSEASFLQFAPSVALALSRGLSLGLGPVLTLGQAAVEPYVFDAPNADGRYSPARATRYHWGAGAQVGISWATPGRWHFGASVKTPAWMETFRFHGQDATGMPRVLRLELDLPMILSLGAAYSGLRGWTFALDGRYFDYAGADGFGDQARFTSGDALEGLGWRSVVALGAGIERRLSAALSVRAGYAWTQSPVRDADAFFNLASPLIYRHTLSAGGSFRLAPGAALNLAYSYFPPAEVTGTIESPAGAIPGSTVRSRLSVHVVSFGIATGY